VSNQIGIPAKFLIVIPEDGLHLPFGAENIGSAWLSIGPPHLAGTARNGFLTTLIQRYERCFLVQHLSKPPLALTVSGGFFWPPQLAVFHETLDDRASAATRRRALGRLTIPHPSRHHERLNVPASRPALVTFRRKIQPGWPVGRIGL
jgi:hypothetical protein